MRRLVSISLIFIITGCNNIPIDPEKSYQKVDPVFARIKKKIEEEDWVKKAEVRFRQEGHVYFGEAFIIPSNDQQLQMFVPALPEM